MFEKFSQLAERMASSASRRDFLGGVGKSALVLVAAAAGLLALPRDASAATGCPPGYRKSNCGQGFSVCCPYGTHCTGSSSFWYCVAHYPPGHVR
jgi:hypothetical protein